MNFEFEFVTNFKMNNHNSVTETNDQNETLVLFGKMYDVVEILAGKTTLETTFINLNANGLLIFFERG